MDSTHTKLDLEHLHPLAPPLFVATNEPSWLVHTLKLVSLCHQRLLAPWPAPFLYNQWTATVYSHCHPVTMTIWIPGALGSTPILTDCNFRRLTEHTSTCSQCFSGTSWLTRLAGDKLLGLEGKSEPYGSCPSIWDQHGSMLTDLQATFSSQFSGNISGQGHQVTPFVWVNLLCSLKKEREKIKLKFYNKAFDSVQFTQNKN